jgi:mannose-1-phosphate guanylyltransferase
MAAVREQADRDGGRSARESQYAGAGIFFPLTHIRAHDPQATVVIYPSNHFVHPKGKFLEEMRHAVWAAERV